MPETSRAAPAVDASASERAAYWALESCRRWAQAVEIEHLLGRAVCDTDPLKLHYDYCLHAIGRLERSAVLAGVDACRRAIEARSLGIADLVLCSIPDAQTLELRKQRDTTRPRRNFEVNAALGEPLDAGTRPLMRQTQGACAGTSRTRFQTSNRETAMTSGSSTSGWRAWASRPPLLTLGTHLRPHGLRRASGDSEPAALDALRGRSWGHIGADRSKRNV